jgi:hypothetical protein
VREALICEPVRKDVQAHDLASTVVRALMERWGLPGEAVDDVLFAQCYPSMEAPALGRVVALNAGLPIETCGLQLDRRCGSGLQAIIYASLHLPVFVSYLLGGLNRVPEWYHPRKKDGDKIARLIAATVLNGFLRAGNNQARCQVHDSLRSVPPKLSGRSGKSRLPCRQHIKRPDRVFSVGSGNTVAPSRSAASVATQVDVLSGDDRARERFC